MDHELYKSRDHLRTTHERWAGQRNRLVESDGYEDEWYAEQCGSCRYWIPLSGAFGSDYGGCSNPLSPFDKHVMFEHDGCKEHEPAGRWIVPDDPAAPSSRE